MPPELVNIDLAGFEVLPALIDKRLPFSWIKPFLRGAAVKTHVEGSRQRGVGSRPGGQPRGVQPFALGDQSAEVATAERLQPGEVEHPRCIGQREFQERGSQVLDMLAATSSITPSTCAGSQTSRGCQGTSETVPGGVVANVAAVSCPAAVAWRASSVPRKPLPRMIRTVMAPLPAPPWQLPETLTQLQCGDEHFGRDALVAR